MTRSILALLLAVFTLMLLVPTAPATAADPVRLDGVIAMVGDGGILLHTRRGDVRIGVVERTQIFVNGERVRLDSLLRGDRAHVEAVWQRAREGRRLVAIRIAVRRQ